MTITFEPLTGGETTATTGRGGVVLAMRGSGFGAAPDAGSAFGRARMRIAGRGTSRSYIGEPLPAVPAHGVSEIYIGAKGTGYAQVFADGTGDLTLRTRGYGPAGAGGRAALQIRASGKEDASPSGYVFIVARQAQISSFAGLEFAQAMDALVPGAGGSTLPTSVVRNRVLGAGRVAQHLEAAVHARSGLTFDDQLTAVYRVLVEEGVVLGAVASLDRTSVERVIERLLLEDRAVSYADAVNQVIAGLIMGALEQRMALESVSDGVAWSPVIRELHDSIERALDAVLAETADRASLTGTVLVSDALSLSPASLSSGEFFEHLVDGVGFAAHLTLDTGTYIAWVMNTESRGLSRYTNYPFNSFAKVGGRYFGAAADGLHQLDGDTDNGEPIAARLRAGLSALGTRRLKRIPEAFIGYTSDGTLLLHVITVSEATGEKEAAIYRLRSRAAVSARENRWKIGRGIKSVDFDFVIENVDGADFDLQSIEFRPVILDRRTRG